MPDTDTAPRTWFARPLETVATFWRVARRDGVTLGFTTHDRDVWFDGVLHRASPGMLPSAIRKSAGFEPDSAEVDGALSHEAISSADLASGRFDGARVSIGMVDWETGEARVLYAGTLGEVAQEEGSFTAALVSAKALLETDPVPRTSPACRARFCGPGCGLNPVAFTHEGRVTACNPAANTVTLAATIAPAALAGGWLRWIDGSSAGLTVAIAGATGAGTVMLAEPLPAGLVIPAAGLAVVLREGCDHTLGSCAARFDNAVNFRGEPFLPGNDLLARYPSPPQ